MSPSRAAFLSIGNDLPDAFLLYGSKDFISYDHNGVNGIINFDPGPHDSSAAIMYQPNGNPVRSLCNEAKVDFKMESLKSGSRKSFGVYLRAGEANEDAYLVLVNASPLGGGTLRIFKNKIWPYPQDLQSTIIGNQKLVGFDANQWHTLKITITNTNGGKDVQITAHVIEPTSNTEEASIETVDRNYPLLDAGKIGFRFYSWSEGKISIKNIMIVPTPVEAN